MIEMLLVGAIVLAATIYSTSALMPAPARQRLARRLLALAEAPRCPAWLGRRIRAAASGPGVSGSPCDGCNSGRPTDDPSR
jgi:hypothetical protein